MARAENRQGPGRPIRVGVVGMGIRGQMYSTVCQALQGAKLVGTCDVAKPAQTAAAERFGVPGFELAEQMCRETRPNAVVVATPDFAHVAPAIAAAEAGCHLLIEKPLAMSTQDARQIVRAVEQAGVRAMVAFENHWNPPIAAMKTAAEAGELGRMVSCTSQLDDRIDVPCGLVSWLGKSSPGWFLLAHTVELSCWIAGQKPLRAQASGVKGILSARGIDTYDAIHAIVDFDGGMVGSFSACLVQPESLPLVYQFRHEMVGTAGAVRADMTDQMLHKATARYEHPSTVGVTMGDALTSPPAQMLAEFISCLANGRPLPCPLADGLVNVAAVEAIHRSIETGRAVKVDA